MWTSLKKILPITINRLNIKKEIEEKEIFSKWQNIIKNKYLSLNNKITPLSFKKGILIISCKNSVLVNEFQLKEKIFLKEINKDNILINKIKFICQ